MLNKTEDKIKMKSMKKLYLGLFLILLIVPFVDATLLGVNKIDLDYNKLYELRFRTIKERP